jgi:crossover junction endodeoxyribonuclease RuvC
MQPRRVLAIDPGIERLGIAVLERGKSDTLLYSECFKTNVKDAQALRLLAIGEKIRETIKKWRPQSLAIETLFFNKNVTSGMRVAEARGVVLYEASRAGLSVYEYSPQAVKIAVTGYGSATKNQIASMTQRLVKIPETKKKRIDDELDAIALGITHLASQKGI